MMKVGAFEWSVVAISLLLGILLLGIFAAGYKLLYSKQHEPDDTPCRAQVVEYVSDGHRCSFVPVVGVLHGYLKDNVCITAEVGK